MPEGVFEEIINDGDAQLLPGSKVDLEGHLFRSHLFSEVAHFGRRPVGVSVRSDVGGVELLLEKVLVMQDLVLDDNLQCHVLPAYGYLILELHYEGNFRAFAIVGIYGV